MSALFVYGTLMQHESLGNLILAASPQRIVPACSPGRLVDLGKYPGLLPARRGGQWVFGEFAEFPKMEGQASESPNMVSLLAQLDFIEEYLPDSEARSLYLRRSVPVVLEDGVASWAWAYLYNRPYDPRSIVRSGDWRRRGK
jgi:gamma-glutamylcyclotransferase (GGCT)/AIG2-like uncharacterized protein YtfP